MSPPVRVASRNTPPLGGDPGIAAQTLKIVVVLPTAFELRLDTDTVRTASGLAVAIYIVIEPASTCCQ